MKALKSRENGRSHVSNGYDKVTVPKTLNIGSKEEADAFVDGIIYAAQRAGASLNDFAWFFVVYPENYNNNGHSPRRFLSYEATQDFAAGHKYSGKNRISASVERVPDGITLEYLNLADPGRMHTEMFRPGRQIYARDATPVQFAL